MFTASGLQVRFLKIIEKSNYQTVRRRPTRAFVFMINSALTRAAFQIKWVRYITKNGEYQYRV
jgi:hypothetical protein